MTECEQSLKTQCRHRWRPTNQFRLSTEKLMADAWLPTRTVASWISARRSTALAILRSCHVGKQPLTTAEVDASAGRDCTCRERSDPDQLPWHGMVPQKR